MTVWGRDASDFDTSVDFTGLGFFTHKVTEGISVTHTKYGGRLAAARASVPVLGSYHVVRTPNASNGSLAQQLAYWVEHMDAATPWWRTWPNWVLQVDAEKWPYDAVSAATVLQFAALLQGSGLPGWKVTYASRGQYGDSLTGIATPLWNADYRGSSGGSYPGDGWTATFDKGAPAGWAPYSGQRPMLLQYTSTPYDKNAYAGTLAELLALTGGKTVAFFDDDNAEAMAYRVDTLRSGSDTVQGGPYGPPRTVPGETMWAVIQLKAIKAAIDKLPTAAASSPLTDADRALLAQVVSSNQAVVASNAALKASVDGLAHQLSSP